MTTSLPSLAEKLGALFLHTKQILVTAESCTGGGLGYWVTSVPGSSQWYERGFITYSNQAKHELLGVSLETLHQCGAVSKETAREMAEGGLKNSHANVCVSITGIAGPEGGSRDKPVGTVWIGLAQKNKPTQTFHAVLTGDRQQIRHDTLIHAFTHLLNTCI